MVLAYENLITLCSLRSSSISRVIEINVSIYSYKLIGLFQWYVCTRKLTLCCSDCSPYCAAVALGGRRGF
jgi:hypothetical protein